MRNTRKSGALGEALAEKYLKSQNYKIIKKNYHSSRLAEIDIIARDGKYLVFVEVKMRTSTAFGRGLEAVTKQKQRAIRYAATHYLAINKLDVPCRFDVLEVLIIDQAPEFTLIKDAF